MGGPLERRLREIEEEMDGHRKDVYAHGPMIGRIMQENIALRERFENRLSATEKRLGLLENFRGQVLLLGAIGYLVLGVVLAGLLQRVFHLSI